MRLKDVIEDVNGNPKAGDTLEMIKKELRKIKLQRTKNKEQLLERQFEIWKREYGLQE